MITLAWYGERKTPYELGENNVHIALVTDDFEGSYQRRKAMGIVCIEKLQKDIYYVEDPDGYEIAVVPAKFHPQISRSPARPANENSGRRQLPAPRVCFFPRPYCARSAHCRSVSPVATNASTSSAPAAHRHSVRSAP